MYPLNKIVLLGLAGEEQIREVRYRDVSGEPGATYYGYVRNNKRFMSFKAMESAPQIVFPTAPTQSSSVVSLSSTQGQSSFHGVSANDPIEDFNYEE